MLDADPSRRGGAVHDRPVVAPNQVARDLFADLGHRYDALGEVLSFGQNARWRRAMIERVLEAGPRRVLDVATGTAGVARQIARRTGASVVGLDLSEEMLREGRRRVALGPDATRITLVLGRAEELPFPDAAFDACTFTYLLRYVGDPAATLRELARVLAPGAPMASLDFAVPRGPLLHPAWWVYTRALLPVGGLLGGRSWVRVGRFLGPSISRFARDQPVPALVDSWRDAGMTDVGWRTMSLGGGLIMWGRRAGG